MNRARFGWVSIVGCAAGALVALSAPGIAHANEDLEACGGIFVAKGEVSCEYRPREECMTKCTTEAVQGACVAKINTMCEGGCTSTATTECESSCTDSCTTECTEKETPPSCEELCTADCKEDFCDDFCEGEGQCNACCGHNCDRKCERKCEDVEDPEPEEVCMTNCSEACTGSCTAQATTECQLDCQTEVIEECETDMVETCETTCEDKGGAIFCDGQFLNASDIDDCAAELAEKVDIDVHIEASVDADVDVCSGDDCDEEDTSVGEEIDNACTVSRVHGSSVGGGAAVLGSLLGLAFIRSRRRSRK